MAEVKDAHIVEIPLDEEHQKKLLCAMGTIPEAIQDHPLTEISDSPGHLLLLKLWQREENLFGRRIALKETRMDSIRQEIFQLCTFFFIFHGFFLTILFTSSVNSEEHACKKWWIPSLLSVSTSLVFVLLAQVKLYSYWKVWRHLLREKNDNRALSRCIQELRMKGTSFDLSKEPQSGKRMKSSSIEIRWKPITWCFQNLLTISLVCFTSLVFPTTKFILCGL
ncbi:RNA polymerase II elongation factor ELL3 isoform 1 [Quillaja saponaria]|uniref:RNA polymerase II elongation factor ELL3 isoform 1 n=1 Tax=Quillaja saponaria TaxID=32244 RepID=A0AAD7PMH5_QUISA|nr:RNA polymerase II elongation factor ELL3 isoform 1 [Quillaja saponaria]